MFCCALTHDGYNRKYFLFPEHPLSTFSTVSPRRLEKQGRT